MKGATKKSLCALLTAALLVSGAAAPGVAEAKAKIKISKKKLTLTVGQKKKLKVKGTKKKVKWSSKNKKIATVTKKGVVKAKKKGTTKIIAKVGKKKYTCKVKVKAKQNTVTITPKPTGNTGVIPNGTNTPGGPSYPGGTNTPGGNSPTPGPTDNSTGGSPTPGPTDNSTGNSPTPGPTDSSTGNSPLPDYTSEPSAEDDYTTPGIISLSTGENNWNYYHKNLGQVTVDPGTTATISIPGVSDWSVSWTNTHGQAYTKSDLVLHETEADGPGQFWENRWKADNIIELDEGVNTIYARVKASYGTREEITYVNTDNIIVRSPQVDDPVPGPDETTPPSQSPTTPTDPPATGERGEDVSLEGKTAFAIGNASHTYNLALGLSKDEVKTVLGDYSLDIMREEKSPQGFDVIAFRQDGNNSALSNADKYKTYILIYFEGNEVVSITAIAPNMSYGDIKVSDLSATTMGNDWAWSESGWYNKTADAKAGAYTRWLDGGGQAIAFIDYYGDKTAYCLQVSKYQEDAIANMEKTWLSLDYSGEITEKMAIEAGELINAYLVKTGKRALIINTKLSDAAKSYSQQIAASGATQASQVGRDSQGIYNAIAGAGLKNFGSWAESILIGNMDSIGFANSAIESSQARGYICDTSSYTVMGLGAGACNDGAHYYPNLVIDFITKVG